MNDESFRNTIERGMSLMGAMGAGVATVVVILILVWLTVRRR